MGESNGFPRAGYAVYVDPGVNWVLGDNTLSVNVPVAVARNLQQTPGSTTGAFADYIIVAAFSHRF